MGASVSRTTSPNSDDELPKEALFSKVDERRRHTSPNIQCLDDLRITTESRMEFATDPKRAMERVFSDLSESDKMSIMGTWREARNCRPCIFENCAVAFLNQHRELKPQFGVSDIKENGKSRQKSLKLQSEKINSFVSRLVIDCRLDDKWVSSLLREVGQEYSDMLKGIDLPRRYWTSLHSVFKEEFRAGVKKKERVTKRDLHIWEGFFSSLLDLTQEYYFDNIYIETDSFSSDTNRNCPPKPRVINAWL